MVVTPTGDTRTETHTELAHEDTCRETRLQRRARSGVHAETHAQKRAYRGTCGVPRKHMHARLIHPPRRAEHNRTIAAIRKHENGRHCNAFGGIVETNSITHRIAHPTTTRPNRARRTRHGIRQRSSADRGRARAQSPEHSRNRQRASAQRQGCNSRETTFVDPIEESMPY